MVLFWFLLTLCLFQGPFSPSLPYIIFKQQQNYSISFFLNNLCKCFFWWFQFFNHLYIFLFSTSQFGHQPPCSWDNYQYLHLGYSNFNLCWLVIGLKNWVLLSSYREGFSSYWIFQGSKVTAARALSGSQNTVRAFPKYLAVVRNLTPTSHFQWCNQFYTHIGKHMKKTHRLIMLNVFVSVHDKS